MNLRLRLPVVRSVHRAGRLNETATVNLTRRDTRRRLYSTQTQAGIEPPLKHVRILDLARVLAGPTCTMLLADLGADVVKVESITGGDDTRSWSPPSAPLSPNIPPESSHLPPESAYFLTVNRNKRSITVNFKTKEGLEILHKLVGKVDVLVENFVPGRLDAMGLGWDDCRKINPKLIYASISGYGQDGPYKSYPGYDVIIEAEAGLMHMLVYYQGCVVAIAHGPRSVHFFLCGAFTSTGEAGRPPVKVGVAATDIATGLYAHGAIMAALISREKTGQGVWIDCNLFESQIAGLANIASNYLIAGQEASRHGTAHPSIAPYEVFECRDGYIMIGAGNNKQFSALAEKVLEIPDLVTDRRFATNVNRVANRDKLKEIITDVLVTQDRDYWLEKFIGQGIPFGPINNIRQTFDHPQAKARGVVVNVEHPRAGNIELVAPAVRYNGQRMPVNRPPPWLSQHTTEVLAELGYSDKQIEEFRERGII